MKVLYVYRNIKMGFSIDNVFRPIEAEMKKHCDVDSIMFENDRYTVKALVNNIKRIRAYLKKRTGYNRSYYGDRALFITFFAEV